MKERVRPDENHSRRRITVDFLFFLSLLFFFLPFFFSFLLFSLSPDAARLVTDESAPGQIAA